MNDSEFEKYPEFVARLAQRHGRDLGFHDALDLGALGLAGEAGEVVDILKKVLFHDKELDKDNLVLELGDVMWYVQHLCNTISVSLEDVIEANIKKLSARYPDKVFDAAQSVAKADTINAIDTNGNRIVFNHRVRGGSRGFRVPFGDHAVGSGD